MKPDELERRMREAARDYNDPPEPPREAMWAAIRDTLPTGEDAGRRRGRRDQDAGVADLEQRRARRLRDRLSSRTGWSIGIAAAATLMVGFGLGRITGPMTERGGGPVAAAASAGPAERGPSLPVRLAAADHLGEAEALLTLFRTSAGEDDRAAAARWARDLLSATRMLLDSRAGQDPELAGLLGDLELVLVQIADAATDPSQRALIEDGIQESQLMSQLRSVSTPADYSL